MRSALLGSNLPTQILNIVNGSKEVASPFIVATLFTVTDLAQNVWTFNDRGLTIKTSLVAGGPVLTFPAYAGHMNIETAESATGGSDNKATITFYPLVDNPLAANTNQSFLAGCHSGLFDATFVQLYWCFMSSPTTVIDVVNIYGGWLGKVDLTRDKISWELNSILFMANIRVPKRMYGPPCTHALYDPGCAPGSGPSPGPNPGYPYPAQYTGAVGITGVSGTLPQQIIITNGNDQGGAFNLGYVRFTSGLNVNLVRTIKTCVGQGTVSTTLMTPLPNTPQIGDTLLITMGCDKTQTTCQNKFNNLNNFGGFPYVPQETVFY
jgi:uncharacterized phage protein (TIGR02218 family)